MPNAAFSDLRRRRGWRGTCFERHPGRRRAWGDLHKRAPCMDPSTARPQRPQKPAGVVAIPPAEFDEYRLLRPLGRGTDGYVYLAQDTLLDRLVAVKFVRAPDRRSLEQFLVEARA